MWEAHLGAGPGEVVFTFVSERSETLLGHAPARFLGDPRFWLEIVHPDERERVTELVRAAARTGVDADFEFRVRHADGRILWLRDIIRVEPATAGAQPRLSGVVIDVTARRRAEEGLALALGAQRESTALLDTIIESAPGGFALFDRDLRYVRVNRALAEINGIAAGAHVGRTVVDVAPGVPVSGSLEPLRRVLATGERVTDLEVTGRTAADPDVEHTWLASYYPIHNARDEIVGLGAFMVDITERKRAEQRLGLLAERERAARRRAAQAQAITAALSQALTAGDVAAVILRDGLPVLGGLRGGVWQLSEDHSALEPVEVEGLGEQAMGHLERLPLVRAHPLTDALRAGRVTWHESPERLLVVPLAARGRPAGTIALEFAEGRTLDDDDLAFVRTLADQCAEALDRARLYDAERRVAATLQRSLLPVRLPRVEGAEFAVRYLAAAGLEAGGDFYEAIPLPGGATGFAVGDVVGRGARAAATMGQLRAALRAFAMSGEPPAEVLRRLSAFASTVENALAATAAYVVLEPGTGELRYCCAGHPWPVLAGPHGTAQFLRGGRSVPLGVDQDPEFVEGAAQMEPGGTLLLYTDGLTERRGADADTMHDRLLVAVGRAAGRALPDLLDAIVAAQDAAAPDDDVALLAVRLSPVAQVERSLSIPARPEQVRVARAQVRTWLEQLGASRALVTDVLLACGEALANAVEHAYAGAEPGAVDVELHVDGGPQLDILVRDHGHWRESVGDPNRGRGFLVMRAIMDEVEVERGDAGTTVRLRRRFEAGTAPPAPPPPAEPKITIVREPQRTLVRIAGDLDLATSGELGERIRRATAGFPLAIDLSAVGHLDSSGARMLVELSHEVLLQVVAPPGSPPRRALELAGLTTVLDVL